MTEDTDTIFQPLSETPSQFADARRGEGLYAAERRLWVAVAALALKDWQFAMENGSAPPISGWSGKNREGRRARMHAELSEWLNGGDIYPGSLLWLGEVFSFDSKRARKRLMKGVEIELPRAEPRQRQVIVRGSYRRNGGARG